MGDKTGALLLYDCLKLRISWLAHRGGNLRCGRADVCVRLYYPDADSDVVGGNCLLYGKSGYEVCDQEDCGSSLYHCGIYWLVPVGFSGTSIHALCRASGKLRPAASDGHPARSYGP